MIEHKLVKQDTQSAHCLNFNEMNVIEKKIYQKPNVFVLQLDEENDFLAASPNVRPGGGGSGSQTPGSINVVPAESDDNNPDDELEG